MQLYKFITESNQPNYEGIKDIVINESVDKSGKTTKMMQFSGPFIQTEVQNKNGRIYPKEIMERAVQKYVADRMSGTKLRSFGELDHPNSLNISLNRISHVVTNLEWKGNDVMGTAKLLDTEYGRLAETILKADCQLGVSSRGLGSLNDDGNQAPAMHESLRRFGENANVVTGFELMAIDIVADPSAPTSFVNGILESKSYVLVGGQFTEYSLNKSEQAYNMFENSLKSLPKKEVDNYLIARIDEFLKNI